MYVISYDLSIDKIRNKVAKELENYGIRVQYSVFECRISKTELKELYKSLANIMQKDPTGNIRIYSICEKCEAKIQTIGIEPEKLISANEDIFII